MPSVLVEVVITTAMTPEQVVNELDDVRHRIRGSNLDFDQKTDKALKDNIDVLAATVEFLGAMVRLDDGTIVGQPRTFKADKDPVGDVDAVEDRPR